AVALERRLHVLARAGELGRVAHDEVEPARRRLLEVTERVVLDGGEAAQAVELEVVRRALERPRRRVDGGRRGRAAARRGHGEAADVRVQVEDARAAGEALDAEAVLALVEERARLLPGERLDLEDEAVFTADDLGARLAPRHAALGREAFDLRHA